MFLSRDSPIKQLHRCPDHHPCVLVFGAPRSSRYQRLVVVVKRLQRPSGSSSTRTLRGALPSTCQPMDRTASTVAVTHSACLASPSTCHDLGQTDLRRSSLPRPYSGHRTLDHHSARCSTPALALSIALQRSLYAHNSLMKAQSAGGSQVNARWSNPRTRIETPVRLVLCAVSPQSALLAVRISHRGLLCLLSP